MPVHDCFVRCVVERFEDHPVDIATVPDMSSPTVTWRFQFLDGSVAPTQSYRGRTSTTIRGWMKTFQGIRVCETLSEIVAPEHTCLVVWDAQNGLTGRVFDKDTYVGRLAPFVAAMRQRVPIVYTLITPLPLHVQSGWGLYSRMRRFNVDDPAKLPGFLVKGTIDAEIPAAMTPHEGDIVLEKSTSNIFVDTPFETMMRNRGIQTLIFTGVATDVGVETSARDAGARGFYPVVVRDGVSSPDREAHERSLQNLERMAIVAEIKDILAAVDGARSRR